MRVALALAIAACGSGSTGTATGSGSGSGSAARPTLPPDAAKPLPAGPVAVSLAPLDHAQLRTLTLVDRFLVIDAHGARHEGLEISGATPYEGKALARGTAVSTETERTEDSVGDEHDAFGILTHETTADSIVIADAGTPARITLRDGIETYGNHKVALAAGAANTAVLYRFGEASWNQYGDLALRIDHLDELAGQHPKSVLLDVPDDATTASLVAALGALSQAGVENVELHRMMGWGAIAPSKKVHVADSGDLVGDPNLVDTGDPHVDGGLSAAGVKSALVGYEKRFRYCFVARDRPIHGSVQLAFDVTADGDVRNARATGLDPKIASCVAASIFDLDIAPVAVHGAGHARAAIAFSPPAGAPGAAPVSGFWCFQDKTVGLCAHEQAQCEAALGGFNGGAKALHDTTIDSCEAQDSAWTKDGQNWLPTKALCGAGCRQVH